MQVVVLVAAVDCADAHCPHVGLLVDGADHRGPAEGPAEAVLGSPTTPGCTSSAATRRPTRP